MSIALNCLSNFSFLRGASHPQELVAQAHSLGYEALALTDECSLAGVVKAHEAAEQRGIKLLIGSEIRLDNDEVLVVLAPDKEAYAELSGMITLARRRAEKGAYEACLSDLRFRLRRCLVIWKTALEYSVRLPGETQQQFAQFLKQSFGTRVWMGISHQLRAGEKEVFVHWRKLAEQQGMAMAACHQVLMHEPGRKPLQDVLSALREKDSVQSMGRRLQSNAEAYLKPVDSLEELYPEPLLEQSRYIASRCHFSLNELKYQYPEEVVPSGETPIAYLSRLVDAGAEYRWPEGVPENVQALIEKELSLIETLHYEYYFLTVYDIVQFARSQGILCQGRGSAANSVVCYCLMITEISPGLINVLFERFISKERNEPPDIDVDFEHSRREEVIQYIYDKYGRERAALAATVICYRPRSAIRDVGRALGFDLALIDHLAKSLAWWDRKGDLAQRMKEAGMRPDDALMRRFYELVQLLQGFPRHLSQHVGGFVITRDRLSDIVPVENAAMPDRTVIQWDKDDLEAMGLMKVDVLALGMLTAIRKALALVREYDGDIQSIEDIPKEDPATYEMLCQADSVGVFQVESRAQMSMLPRLKPRCFYDLVIQIAIVRPGPIQGGMVHPYLKRRNGEEPVNYHNEALKAVLAPTLGVPIFQEQAIRLSMVAAGFSGGEADRLRRAMAAWGKNSTLMKFEQKFIHGMLGNGYSQDFAERTFEQIKGFGGYGFPESHSASFAILCYFSSWLKRHHPAAFYCALLNSQPMGFYSPSQLLQDARRHDVSVLPVDINASDYEHSLQDDEGRWAIRLGLSQIRSLDADKGRQLVSARADQPFRNMDDLVRRSGLSNAELQLLASAEALRCLSGHRYQARWAVSGTEAPRPLLSECASPLGEGDTLKTRAPSIEQDIFADMRSTKLSLRPHLAGLLRREAPFSRCRRQDELLSLRSGSFVQVFGLVTGRQRPGTAHGTLFLTLEDETGNINVIVWSRTQALFRKALLAGKLLLIKGNVETEGSVVHVVAGQILDYSTRLAQLELQSRDFH